MPVARRKPPADVLRAIEEHLRERHGRDLTPGLIGAKTARASTALIAWDPGRGDEGGASFRCRACEAGFDRFYTEVDCAIPSPRLVERIREHFSREGHGELRDDEIFHEENKRGQTRASFIGATPAHGAQIVCRDCGPGLVISLAAPPRGDARRILYLLRNEPGLRSVARTGYTKEVADYVRAWDTGALRERDLRLAASALRQAKPRQPRPERVRRQRALVATVRARRREGMSVTSALAELSRLAENDPVAFLCALGVGDPALTEASTTAATPGEFAQRVAVQLGLPKSAPVLSARTLRRYWSESAAASEQDAERPRRSGWPS